jgi:hypothetical protein
MCGFGIFGRGNPLSPLLAAGGPLSRFGPLGSKGALGDAYESFPEKFRAEGTFAILGPLGPLGPAGPLGPLGPLGGHGFSFDRYDGRYRQANASVVTSVSVSYDEKRSRNFDLFEFLSADVAKKYVNDTTFMTRTSLEGESTAVFFAQVNRDQWLSILVVPEHFKQLFSLSVESVGGTVRVHSRERRWINWVAVCIPSGTKLKISTQRLEESQGESWFRLIVLGVPKTAIPASGD